MNLQPWWCRARRLMLVTTLAVMAARAEVAVEHVVDVERLKLASQVRAKLDSALASEDWTQAEGILFRASIDAPDDASILRALGAVHHQAGRNYAAAAALKRADAIRPLPPADRHLLANAYLRMKRDHWARAEFERLVEEVGDSASHRISLARIHYRHGRFEAGASHAREALRLEPRSALTSDLLGQCLEGLGKLAEAERRYRDAIEWSRRDGSGSAWPHYHLGSLLHAAGKLEEAESDLARAAEIDPQHAPALTQLGIVRRKRNRMDAAAEALEAAVRVSPAEPKTYYLLGQVYRRLGKEQAAREALERFRKLSP